MPKNMSNTAMFLAPNGIQDTFSFIYCLQYIHICHLILPAKLFHSSPSPHFKGLLPLSFQALAYTTSDRLLVVFLPIIPTVE